MTEDAARFLSDALAGQRPRPEDEAGWDQLAVAVTAATTAAGRFVPAGHPVHKVEDRRAGALRAARGATIASGPPPAVRGDREGASRDPGQDAAVERRRCLWRGPRRPRPPCTSCGASPSWPAVPGSSATLAEEQADPVGMDIYLSVDRNVDYRP